MESGRVNGYAHAGAGVAAGGGQVAVVPAGAVFELGDQPFRGADLGLAGFEFGGVQTSVLLASAAGAAPASGEADESDGSDGSSLGAGAAAPGPNRWH